MAQVLGRLDLVMFYNWPVHPFDHKRMERLKRIKFVSYPDYDNMMRFLKHARNRTLPRLERYVEWFRIVDRIIESIDKEETCGH